jgi:aspartate carbamoyltransferase catalytic subunit
LLDLLTIYQDFKKFKGLTILIVGDIIHSRVAHSNIKIMKRLGMNVLLSAPKEFQDPQYEYIGFEEGIKKADVINLLRIQNERLTEQMHISIQEYNKLYGMTMNRVTLMKPKSIIIHPAPFNRGIEIDNEVVECKQSRIFKQMNNGVYIRMIVLSMILSN